MKIKSDLTHLSFALCLKKCLWLHWATKFRQFRIWMNFTRTENPQENLTEFIKFILSQKIICGVFIGQRNLDICHAINSALLIEHRLSSENIIISIFCLQRPKFQSLSVDLVSKRSSLFHKLFLSLPYHA